MSTHNIPFSVQKRMHPKLSQSCSCGIFSKGLKNEFETAMVNEPSVFKPLKVYCILKLSSQSILASVDPMRLHPTLVLKTAGLPRSGKNVWKMIFFQVREKSGNFRGWQVEFRKDLGSQGKVREFENKWLCQSSENLFILFRIGKDVLSHEIV